MSRRHGIIVALVAVGCAALPAAELPKGDDEETFEVEPPILIPNRDADDSLGERSKLPASAPDPQRLEKELDRATKNAAGAERLFKMGVLARAEVEQRTLRVIRLQSDLENARVLQLQEDLKKQESRAQRREISGDELSQTQRALAQAVQTADAAAAKRERAELEAAEVNLRRQKKLMALGIGRKAEVVRAEERLAELKTAKPPKN